MVVDRTIVTDYSFRHLDDSWGVRRLRWTIARKWVDGKDVKDPYIPIRGPASLSNQVNPPHDGHMLIVIAVRVCIVDVVLLTRVNSRLGTTTQQGHGTC